MSNEEKAVKAAENSLPKGASILSRNMSSTNSKTSNTRPSLTRAETIESCNSDDLVTVLEVRERRPFKIVDRWRITKKGVMADSLQELVHRGKEKLGYLGSVCVVLEEDGTEVDEEEYFATLPENTVLMLMHPGDCWTPQDSHDLLRARCHALLENEIQV